MTFTRKKFTCDIICGDDDIIISSCALRVIIFTIRRTELNWRCVCGLFRARECFGNPDQPSSGGELLNRNEELGLCLLDRASS